MLEYAKRRVARLVHDEGGQDLLDYALLTGTIAIAGVLVFGPLRTTMRNAYQSWNTNVQAIWTPAAPTGG